MYNDYYDSYNLGSNAVQTATGAGVLVGTALIFVIFMVIIALAAAIIQLIATMKIFKKAGKPGWAAFVPGYSNVLTCEIGGIDPRWVLIELYSGIVCIIPLIGFLAYLAVIIYYLILANVSLARAFGKSDGFAVGLILLPVVFYPILGFGSAKYGNINPMNDIIFKKKAN
jgi:hypothetical protein